MWEPFRLSIEEWAPDAGSSMTSSTSCNTPTTLSTKCGGRSFSGKGGKARLIKGKKWLLLSRWKNLTAPPRRTEPAVSLNRRVLKAYMLKESLEQLWDYQYEGAMLNYLQRWMDQLRWQRLQPVSKNSPRRC